MSTIRNIGFNVLLVVLMATSSPTYAIPGITVAPSSSEIIIPDSALLALGMGVNHVSSDSSKEEVTTVLTFNLSDVNILPLDDLDEQDIIGSSFATFSSKMAASASIKGSGGGYSAALSASYGVDSSRSSNTFFSSKSRSYIAGRYWLAPDPIGLRSLLSDNFKAAINAMEATSRKDARNIINNYGSHVRISALIGSKASVLTHSESSSSMTSTAFESKADLAYEGAMGSASAEARYSKENTSTSGSSHLTTTIKVQGGTTPPAGYESDYTSGKEGTLKTWLASSHNPNNLVLISAGLPCKQDPTENAALRDCKNHYYFPIWELIENEEKSNAVHQAFYALALKSPVIRTFKADVTRADSSKTFDNDANEITGVVAVPRDYLLLSGGVQTYSVAEESVDRWPLIKSSFPKNNGWQASVKYVNLQNYGTVNPSGAQKITVYAKAIHNPYNLWEQRATPVEAIANTQVGINYSNFSVPLPTPTNIGPGFHLVGGGAETRIDGNSVPSILRYAQSAGPFLTASHPVQCPPPNEQHICWSAGFATTVDIQNYARDHRGPAGVDGWPPNNFMGWLLKDYDDRNDNWGQKIRSHGPMPTEVEPRIPSSIFAHTIGLKINKGVYTGDTISLATHLDHLDLESKAYPSADIASTSSCNLNLVTGGLVSTGPNPSPFFLSSTYPSTDTNGAAQWSARVDNGMNAKFLNWQWGLKDGHATRSHYWFRDFHHDLKSNKYIGYTSREHVGRWPQIQIKTAATATALSIQIIDSLNPDSCNAPGTKTKADPTQFKIQSVNPTRIPIGVM